MQVGSFAILKVMAVQDNGAFLGWKNAQRLFLPRREQDGEVFLDEELVVFIALDQQERPFASMRIEEFLDHDPSKLVEDQKVDLLIFKESDLGFKAIIDLKHLGVIYLNEVFQPLGYGDRVSGYVKKIRPDGKVDLILSPRGNKGASDLGQRIIEELEAAGGFLPLTEKSPPEAIYDLFGVSKNKYKIALGGLYKRRQVTLHPDGVRLA